MAPGKETPIFIKPKMFFYDRESINSAFNNAGLFEITD